MNPVLDYIEEKKWEYRVSGDELIVKSCPYCGKRDYKFYVNQKTRLFLCFHASCATKGHISKLKKHLGDVVEMESISAVSEEKDFTSLVNDFNMMLVVDINQKGFFAVGTADNRFMSGIIVQRDIAFIF